MEMQSKPDYIKILASIIVFLLPWIKCLLGNDPNSATVLVLHSKHILNVSFILMKRFHHLGFLMVIYNRLQISVIR